jgi:hypothetical protein
MVKYHQDTYIKIKDTSTDKKALEWDVFIQDE